MKIDAGPDGNRAFHQTVLRAAEQFDREEATMQAHTGRGRIARLTATLAIAAVAVATTAFDATAQTKVRYSEVIRSIFYLPSYIALKKGYFGEQGIEVDMSTAWGSDRSVPKLLAGSIDIALLGPESAIYIENSPSPTKTKIFCALTAKDGLVMMSRKKMTPQEFRWDMVKGKVFLDWRHGVTPQIDGEWVLKKHGLDPEKDLRYITNVASPNRNGAWLGGTGDFGTFFEPTVSLFQREGKGYPLVSIGKEIGPVDYTVYMATDDYLAKNAKTAQGWCNAITKAQKDAYDADAGEIAKLVSSFFPKLDLDLLVSSIERYRDLEIWKRTPLTEPAAIEKMQDIMVAGGVMKPDQRVAYEKVVVRGFAEAAIKMAR